MERRPAGESEQSRQLQYPQEIQFYLPRPRVNRESSGGNEKDQVASVARRQALGPHQGRCVGSLINLLTKNWGWLGSPLSSPQGVRTSHSSSHYYHSWVSGDATDNLQKVLEITKTILEIVLFSLELITNPLTQLIKPLKMFSFLLYICVYIHMCIFF